MSLVNLDTPIRSTPRNLASVVLFAMTLFVSAFLLFLVQPLIAKMILPKFGGTSAVWNTCMIFFQAALLAGYAYAHAATTWMGARRQAAMHMVLVALALISLPIAVSGVWAPSTEMSPALALLGLLLRAVGLPFFIVATSGPLLQKWFAGTGHPAAKDPYFLYAASNFGSLLALLSYPLLVEPLFTLRVQSRIWTAGYVLFALLTLVCAYVIWRFPNIVIPSEEQPDAPPRGEGEKEPLISPGLRLRWVALAFAPSSLMIGVTSYMSTDLAPIPLIWVIPLSLYLITFILAFARLPARVYSLSIVALPILVLLFTLMTFLEERPETRPSIVWVLVIHLATFFLAALACHSTLARNRPPTSHLTEYYLWIAVGGVLGGAFNGLMAPLLFRSVAEYYLAIVLACLLMPNRKRISAKPLSQILDLALPAVLGILTAAFLIGFEHQKGERLVLWLSHRWSNPKSVLDRGANLSAFLQSRTVLQLLLPLAICAFFMRRPIRFGLGVGAILLAGTFVSSLHSNVLDQKRNFFGVVRVISPEERDLFGRLKSPYPADFHFMVHGNIVHGAQLFRPEPSRVPLAYFYPTGPVGQVFAEFRGPKKKPHVAVIGLGAGTLASYGEPGQEMAFYEINPAVVAMAENPCLFTYLRDCQADWHVILGDARLRLREASDDYYDIIILDAFSSDAIPVHLLTREAFELYLSKLRPDGIIVMQMTNRYLDLAPLAGRLAEEFHLVCLDQDDQNLTGDERGKAASHWAVLARHQADLGHLIDDGRWQPVSPGIAPLWTDDFSNLLSILKWKQD
jgi:hypothetical protein